GSFIRRRLGDEVHDHIAEPLLSGIYAGDTDKLSVLATFPQFLELERKKRSIILGMMNRRQSETKSLHDYPLPSAARNSVFLTFKNGLSSIVEALASELNEVRILTGVGLDRISSKNDSQQPYEIQL